MSRGAIPAFDERASVVTIALVLGFLILMVCAMFLTARSGGPESRPGQTLSRPSGRG
ncbi:MAG TPA: hypothetical protein VM492_01730 [Sumerlaeia bacterium]|nr:hypothetical protein [Sumerlaeia bacterium]